MPCPTCDHTMQGLFDGNPDRQVWWCPRCGTIKTRWKGFNNETKSTDVPRIAAALRAANDSRKAIVVAAALKDGEPAGWWECRSNELAIRGETPINALSGLARTELQTSHEGR